jgi:hypothetical protein
MNRRRWWIIGGVALVVLVALALLGAWLYSDLLLQYD